MSEYYVLVHADGGACHGTPIEGFRCPKCGITPDMQSTEFWLFAEGDIPSGVRRELKEDFEKRYANRRKA